MSSTVAYIAPMAVLFKEYIEKMPDTLNTKKEIDEYIKIGMKEIMEMKKAKKDAEPKKRPTKKAKKEEAEAGEADAEKEAEKAKKAAEKAKKAEEKAAEKAAEKAKKAEEKAAEKAKKAEENAAEKSKKSEEKASDAEDSDDNEPKKRPEKKAKAAKAAKATEIDEEGNVVAKAKKPPTERKIFYDEMRIKVKEMFPDLNPQQTTKKIAELWKVKLARLAEANEEAMNAAINTSS